MADPPPYDLPDWAPAPVSSNTLLYAVDSFNPEQIDSPVFRLTGAPALVISLRGYAASCNGFLTVAFSDDGGIASSSIFGPIFIRDASTADIVVPVLGDLVQFELNTLAEPLGLHTSVVVHQTQTQIARPVGMLSGELAACRQNVNAGGTVTVNSLLTNPGPATLVISTTATLWTVSVYDDITGAHHLLGVASDNGTGAKTAVVPLTLGLGIVKLDVTNGDGAAKAFSVSVVS